MGRKTVPRKLPKAKPFYQTLPFFMGCNMVTCLSSPNALYLALGAAYIAAKQTYGKDDPHELSRLVDYCEIEQEDMEHFLGKIVSRGHFSVLGHAHASFLIEGVSKNFTHQLVRHHVGITYTQMSDRRTDMSKRSAICPASISKDPQAGFAFKSTVRQCREAYAKLVEKFHIPPEDARYIMPTGCTTSIVATANLWAWHHIIEERTCQKAQWEFRGVAGAILDELRNAYPVLTIGWGPKCLRLGRCPEEHSCGYLNAVSA